MPTWTIMVPDIHPAVPLLPRGAVPPLLLLLSCLVLSSQADSKYCTLCRTKKHVFKLYPRIMPEYSHASVAWC